ncbi:DUF998 domain-containing protein [Enterococcus quebecensis]|uniref:DUF998 domain-containing protein n=1 Tax=Enterococcus quebecensis TaxID=903983 RepID=A0A1E5GQH8_9ENTE|nr:DUF998 domain-containing protein [Enterococcus quebecensis]OEG14929.1 hypothetical protein BCR23_11120 [Enterococcus quebecensis]OJG74273.1 hypothetical protein RV12_GL002620 [Enterococcus quebecensis]
MNVLKKYGFLTMILVIISELTVPWILIHFYSGYNPVTMLISDFGEDGSPTKVAFKIWQLIDGSLFLLTIPSFYERFKNTSKPLANWLSVMMATFAIGDCFITGIFDRSTNLDKMAIESLIHDYASGAGFVALLLAILILIKLYRVENHHSFVTKLIIIFIISACFMFLFAAPKIPIINQLNIPYRGLWQRVNLLFLYLPFLFVSFKNLRFQ